MRLPRQRPQLQNVPGPWLPTGYTEGKGQADVKDITKPDTMRDLQGDIVLAHQGKEEMLLTVVRVMEDPQHLLLSNRAQKPHERESFPLTQDIANEFKPSKDPRAKWDWKL